MKGKMNNTIVKISVFVLLLIIFLGINNISRADIETTGSTIVVTSTEVPKTFNTRTMMPERNINGVSGMFPQYYVRDAVRTVTLDNNRYNWFTNNWTATISGKVVYCSAYGRYVRYGQYETNEHIIYPGINTLQGSNYTVNGMQTLAQSVNAAAERFKESVQNYININGIQYYENDVLEESALTSAADTVQVTIEYLNGGDIADINGIGFAYSGNVSSSGYELDPSKRGEAMNHAQNTSFNIFANVFSQLTGIHPGDYSPSIDDGNYSYSINDTNKSEYIVEGNGVIGPEVIVIENGQGANNGYKNSGTMTFTNDQKAFVFSTSEDAYGDVNQKYTLNDIQGAYWRLLRQIDHDRKPTEDTTFHITANADKLYEQSNKYINFRNEILANGYENFVEFNKDDSEFQVVADRENEKYIIGPLSITYPMEGYEDLSYLKALMVKGANGNTLVYDEIHSDFEVVLQTIPGATNNNGLKNKAYPISERQNFYIVVEADKIGTETKQLELSARFEYITDTKAEVDGILTATADIYTYYGHASVDNNSPYRMKQGTVRINASYIRQKNSLEEKHNSRCPGNNGGRCQEMHDTYCRYSSTGVCSERDCCYIKTIRRNEEKEHDVYQLAILLQPFIKMGTDVRTAEAQKLIVVGDAKRKYEAVTVNMENPIDLTMELGGFVWVDADGGKEDISNGLFDNSGEDMEIRVPHVPVKLYRKDNNELIGETKTNSNGEYRFKDLNAMYQYYVVFTYNGQYYQPTTFADATTWGTENWRKNSNAKDTKSVREAYNLKFESIGPAPENYKTSSGNYNETFTKLELLGYTLNTQGKYEKTREAVIDDFGNLILENSTDPITKKMIEYVKDCMIDASTIADGANGYYPEPSLFVIDNKPVPNKYMEIFHNDPARLYNDAYYINLGLDERQESDLAVKKDIEKVTLEINGQTHDYYYDTLENKENADKQWDISVRLSDHYYDTAYTRTVYESDYMYKTSIYGDAAKYGKSEKDELQVYITYKIMIDNQAMSIQTKVNEIADYYDKDLEYIDERSYIEIKKGENKGRYAVRAEDESRYNSVPETIIPGKDESGYDNLYITGLDDKYLTGGQRAYIYLTFRVEKDTEGYVLIDKQIQSGQEIGVGKENLVEINGYSTRYAKGTQVPNVGDVSFKPAGIVDRDSKPGNLKDSGIEKDSIYNTNNTAYTKFEDDNDKSPNLKLIVLSDYAREISGNVWEDLRNENINETATGDGIRGNNENTLIDGVTVQLVELMDNGTEYVWREFGDKGYTSEEFKALSQDKQKEGIGGNNTIGKGTGTGTKTSETPIINAYNLIKNYEFGSNQDGAYAFKSFVPGKYVVRFIYGDTVKTVAPKSLNMGGLNEKSYNGQDYKSTTYQEGITLNKTYEWRKESTWELGIEKVGDIIRKISTYDKNVCNQNEKGTYLHDISAADKNANVSDAKDIESIRNAVNAYSKGEVTNDLAEVLASGKAEYNTMNNRTQLFDKLIQNTKMTAETGVIVIELEYDAIETDGTQDRTYKVQNVNLGLEERPRAQLIIDKEVANAKITLANGSVLFDATNTTNNVLWKDHKAYDVGYVKGLMDSAKFGSIENIRKRNAKKFGLVQISMDEELMHGATIQITYKISAINVGEVDYNDNSFYYTGNVKDKSKVVTSNAKQVIDYVANNLQFSANKNSNWEQISKAEIQSQRLVNEKIINELDKYNTIITSTSLDKELVPSLYKETVNNNAIDTVSTQLVLSKVISPENDTDDLTYRNIVEIVKTTNTAGRRMEYSVVGNQIPGQEPQELDTDIAEAVKILPPFGNAGIYIIITITAMLALTIIILGTFFIKKKVLKK